MSAQSTTSTDRTESPWVSVARSAGTRVLVLPLTAVLGIINTRLIIEHFGSAAYAQYGLLVAIGALLPFADMGMSAAIMNTVGGSEHPSTDPAVRDVLITSVRVLCCSAAVLLAVTGLITLLGGWTWLLGDGLLPGTGPAAAALCVTAIALTLPISFGQRVLTGLGKNHLTIGLLGLQTPVVLGSILVLIALGATGNFLPVVPYVATMLLIVVAAVVAGRLIRPQVTSALRAVPRLRTERGGRVFHVAWPMLVQAIALPIAMQTDRLVLSHMSTSDQLATYNLSAQMFLPVWQVVVASGAALWPIFARARSRGTAGEHSPVPIAGGFAAAAFAVCLLISLVSPWLADFASDGELRVPLAMLVTFTFYMVFQAVQYPLGQFLTDAAGLRYQAVLIVLMVPFNLGISIPLAGMYGAVGPVIGSAVAALVFQVIGNYVYVRRRLGRAATAAQPA